MNANEALKKYFGYDNYRSGQLEIIEQILDNKNVLAVLPTGAGKSICFQIPALISDNYSIVISPLIALMKDQVDSLNKQNEIAAFINSTQSFYETEKVLQDVANGKIKLVYVAPERLENPEFALRLKNLNPQFLFIDEAHCISEWGHNFRPSYTKLKDFIEFSGIKKISAFTATATPEVVQDIVKQLGLKNANIIVKGFERENLFINAEITKKKKERTLELIHQFKSPAIIYASSRKKTEELSEFLKQNKINCQYYHAGLDPIIRKKIQEDFIEDRLPVIIATNAFGMGIDKKDIRLVVHLNSPGSIENYYQEIGRAGRDGRSSYTYLLFEESDIYIHEYFISNSYPTKELIKNIYNALCDNAQISIGSLPQNNIPINQQYIKLHTKQDISNAVLYSSLKYLENSGYISINSVYKAASSIKILFEQKRLKNFIKNTTNLLMKDVLLFLVRNYGTEIFAKHTSINFNKLQTETGLTKEEVNDTLTNLEFLSLLEFSKSDGKESITLRKPRVKSEDLKLNYKLINELYISSKQKLDKMVDFIYSLDCRFKFILKYFGEDAENYSCGKCDNCLTEQSTTDSSLSYIKEIVFELLSKSELELTEKTITDILLGKENDKEHKHLEYFNSLNQYKNSDIIFAIKVLAAENKIQQKKEGKQKLFFIQKNSYSHIAAEVIKSDEYEKNLELFHLLREAREKASKKFLQSGNIICADNLLGIISQQKPKTRGELLSITGFNERMFNKIGDDFLEILNSDFETKAIDPQRKLKIIPPNIIETYNLLKKKYSLSEISKLRKLNEAVISMQIETILGCITDVDISAIVTEEQLQIIKNEIDKGFKGLKDLKEKLPLEFSYSVIRIALAKFNVQHV